MALTAPSLPGTPHYQGFTITFRNTTLGTTPLDIWSTIRKDLNLTTYCTHKIQTSTPPAGFEPVIPSMRATADPNLRSRSCWDLHQ
jgi:hypothetical protein